MLSSVLLWHPLMAKKDFVSIKRAYPEFADAAESFLLALLEDVTRSEVITDTNFRIQALERIARGPGKKPYTFIDLMYVLKLNGELDSTGCERTKGFSGAYLVAKDSSQGETIRKYLDKEANQMHSTNFGRKNRPFYIQIQPESEKDKPKDGIIRVTKPYTSTSITIQ